MNYTAVLLLADALEKAGSADRAEDHRGARASTFAGHVMPYGPTKFVNGQNQGAAPVNTQVIGNDIQVIFPASFASAKPVFPMPAEPEAIDARCHPRPVSSPPLAGRGRRSRSPVARARSTPTRLPAYPPCKGEGASEPVARPDHPCSRPSSSFRRSSTAC